jgi:FixJ family two-component response regulator/GAF domain-containing protein
MKLPFAINASVGIPIWAIGTGEPIQVLLVDDDDDELKLTRSILERVKDVNYQLDWVPTFGDGLASIARDEHDAYLIDHQLGGQTGVDLVREARQAGSLAALIMLTGHRDRATDMAAMDAGATDFLMKGRTDAAMLDRTLRYSISHVAMMSNLDRSRSQITGLEELGRILVREGPTPSTIARIVDLIVERFGLDQVAIYLTHGDSLYLAGQHGYGHPVPSISRRDASVDRVARARQPIFIPSLSPEPFARDARDAIATELSVPLIVAGELLGLLNVASPVAAPIGEQDYAAVRLIADRLTLALEVSHEREKSEDRLAAARRRATNADRAAGDEGLLDAETQTYRRAMLEPLIEVAIAASGKRGRRIGLLLVAPPDAELDPDFMIRLASQAEAAFARRPRIRFGEAGLAVLFCATDPATARSEAADLAALAESEGLRVCCGFAVFASMAGPAELIAAAEASLILAQHIGAGTVLG